MRLIPKYTHGRAWMYWSFLLGCAISTTDGAGLAAIPITVALAGGLLVFVRALTDAA